MGDQLGDDAVEDIIAEPEVNTPGLLQTIFLSVHEFVIPNAWYIIAIALGIYFLWKNKVSPVIKSAKSPEGRPVKWSWLHCKIKLDWAKDSNCLDMFFTSAV